MTDKSTKLHDDQGLTLAQFYDHHNIFLIQPMKVHVFLKYPAQKRRKAYEKVADVIRAQVLTGDLKEGQRLPPERNLAEGFGVSRVVIREAIRTLEMSGMLLVRKGSGGGTFISAEYDKPLIASLGNLLWAEAISLDHLFEIRLLLEPKAAYLATIRACDSEIDELEKLLIKAESNKHDAKAIRDGNLEFHRKLVSLAQNPLLTTLCQTVLKLLVESMQDQLNLEVSLNVLPFHRLVLKALRQRKPLEAENLLREDLDVLKARYKKITSS